MAKCSRCGEDLVAGKSYCAYCGARIDDSEQSKENNYDIGNIMYAGKDFANEFDARDIVENKVFSILSYLGILFVIGLIAKPDSKVVKFHANQGCILSIIEIAIMITGLIISYIPIIGGIIGILLGIIIGVLVLAVFVYQLINILDGKVKKLPIIGNITIIK